MLCSSSTRPSKSIPGFCYPSAAILETPFRCINSLHFRQNAPPIPFNLRLKNSVKLELLPKSFPTYASKTSSSEGSDGKNDDGGQGPPFLTILAGFLVFFAVCWLIGSLVMWLISLFVHSPPSK